MHAGPRRAGRPRPVGDVRGAVASKMRRRGVIFTFVLYFYRRSKAYLLSGRRELKKARNEARGHEVRHLRL